MEKEPENKIFVHQEKPSNTKQNSQNLDKQKEQDHQEIDTPIKKRDPETHRHEEAKKKEKVAI